MVVAGGSSVERAVVREEVKWHGGFDSILECGSASAVDFYRPEPAEPARHTHPHTFVC